jgi:hypothetical protein
MHRRMISRPTGLGGIHALKIITRINAGDAAEDISRLIGEQEVERRIQSETHAGGRVSRTESVQRDIRRVVTASELGSRLGPNKRGVRALFIGLADAVYELELPYISLPKYRDPIVPADWTHAPPPPPPKGSNGQSRPTPPPLTRDLADQIRRRRD